MNAYPMNAFFLRVGGNRKILLMKVRSRLSLRGQGHRGYFLYTDATYAHVSTRLDLMELHLDLEGMPGEVLMGKLLL